MLKVIVDDIDENGIANCRSWADAPEIGRNLYTDKADGRLVVGDVLKVDVDKTGEYGLWGALRTEQ
ncbi:hypothetical protein [Yoonia maricola]|uniref:hypothetical protein n=1 Tax=Yoonia maricola TaxID=420999 RepID=UPI002481ACEA|nr:hypothetical protein [Yoonia maricola]